MLLQLTTPLELSRRQPTAMPRLLAALGSSEARKLGSSEAELPPTEWLSSHLVKYSYAITVLPFPSQ